MIPDLELSTLFFPHQSLPDGWLISVVYQNLPKTGIFLELLR
jgi:hypothetical protein